MSPPLRSWLALALGVACATSPLAAEICKWVDRDGAVHYADVPPPGQGCSERIAIQHADPVERARAEERRAAMQRQADAIGREDPRAPSSQAEKVAQREQRCASARDELRFLAEAEGLRLLRPGRQGEEAMVWLDDAQRAALIEAWRRQVQGWCETTTQEPAAPPSAVAVPPPPRR